MTTLKEKLKENSFRTAITDKEAITIDNALNAILEYLYQYPEKTNKELQEEIENEPSN